MKWDTGGIKTNPTANSVLCDSGPLTATTYGFEVFIASEVAMTAKFQLLDAASVMLKEQIIPVLARAPFSDIFTIEVPEGGRARVIMNANATGSVQASMFYNG